ncbi:tRNA pseudouridine(55) synthase TruB [Marinibactrum halimedae]|uniref:tRNA pseudouridine synthase B n=1 Tax=Marinibactrum halimedae TaxID=1444977 RepID=A0AA37WQ25_9GAMM|nr:tRNA pseudouridine(55) synthase TruB [Marinibactrum halimedae]MCD9458998.1 tRNA pseudouridine(55) synthase TruB [Marinibactrum halimedae]GLS26872.1 tRNA pseudouridine synthase B [Marinibactrum halimedae]
MAPRRAKGRSVNGVLVLNKPLGLSSNQALQRVKRLFNAAKAGHTGALDPLATGVLPLCFGEATKFSQFLLDSDKRYKSTFVLGRMTDSGDCDGEVINEVGASNITRESVESAMMSFRGGIDQVPPMHSALKHNGVPLYKLARKGETIERKPRHVEIHRFELLSFIPGQYPELVVDIHCSKGTYVRSLATDLGAALGVGGMVTELHRTGAGKFLEADAVALEDLERLAEEKGEEALDALLHSVDSPVSDFPKVTLDTASSHYFHQGQAVTCSKAYRLTVEGGMVRVFNHCDDFLGVAVLKNDGQITPKRLVVQ